MVKLSGWILPAVLAGVVGASVVTWAWPGAAPVVSESAGVAAMARLADAHDATAQVSERLALMQRDLNTAAAQQMAEAKLAAIESAETAAMQRLALADVKVPRGKPRSVAAKDPAAESVSERVAEPLQLASMMTPVQPVQQGNTVVRRVRDAVATVERIPDWVRHAANSAVDWVADLPGQVVPSRRFVAL